MQFVGKQELPPEVDSAPGVIEFGYWQHVFLSVSKANGAKMWVDNKLVVEGDYSDTIETNQDIFLGNFQGVKEGLNGYMSQTVLVEGQALLPTTFGKAYEGRWGPLSDTDILANVGNFGPNGFLVNYSKDNTGGFLENLAGNLGTLTAVNIDNSNVYEDNPMNVHAVLEVGTNGGLVGKSNGNFDPVPWTGTAGQQYYYEKNGTAQTYTAGSKIAVSTGDVFNFGQYAYSDLNSGNLPDLVLGFKGIDGLTLNADDPDDVEKFYAIKAALVQYESERIDFQQLMVDALVAAGFTTDQIAAYIDE